MKKNLGLDVGTNSIGWALVIQNDDADDMEIVDMGVRIISADATHARDFEKGRPITLNATRRDSRSIRRGNQRYKHRHKQLKAVLCALKMMPDDNLLKNIKAVDLYGLRDKALTGKRLELPEIGRILIQLSQRRGYKSNRKTDGAAETEQEKSTEKTEAKADKKIGYVEAIQNREAEIKALGLTIGQYFFQKLTVDEHYRIKEQIFTRASYEAEFEAIWRAQSVYYSNVLTEANREKIQHEILFYQRQLKSQKHLVTKCTFEKNLKAAPKSSPLFQTFKVLQIVNNMTITNSRNANSEGYDNIGERRLTTEERQKAVHYLENEAEGRAMAGDAFLKKVISPAFLKHHGYKLNLDKVDFNTTKAAFRKVFKDNNHNATAILNNPKALDTLWQKVYSIEEPERLFKVLTRQKKDVLPDEKPPSVWYEFNDKLADAIVKMHLAADYGSLSAKAIKKLMPFLAEGLTYVEACKAVYELDNHQNAAYNTHHEKKEDKRERTLADQMTLIGKGALRNPVVEQIVNQVINVVNKIIETPQYVSQKERQEGDFEIRVELARELQQNAKRRQADTKRMGENGKKNKDIEDILKAIPIYPTLRNIEKYKLWDEQGRISPYSGKKIELAELFDTNQYEIEHVIPRSRYFDDSLTNKVIAETVLNREKGKRLGHEFMESRGVAELERYVQQINDNPNFSAAKKRRLLATKIPEDNVQRQLKETQYITKALTTKLREICHEDRVTVTSGSVTSYLREIWGLNRMLQNLNWERYEANDQVQYIVRDTAEVLNNKAEADESEADGHQIINTIKDWTKRDNHRHHAVDALVIACTKQSIIQKLNSLRGQSRNDAERPKFMPPLTPAVRGLLKKNINFDDAKHRRDKMVEAFVIDATAATDSILVSHRQKRKVVTTSKNTIAVGKGANRRVLHQQTDVLTPRGRLHQDSIYGKRFEMIPLTPTFNRWNEIADETIKALVIKRLKSSNGDPSVAFANYRKNPIWLNAEQTQPLRHVPIGKPFFVIKYELSPAITQNQLDNIIDPAIKDIVFDRLKSCENSIKKAFGDMEKYPLFLNKEKGIRIRTVSCKARVDNATPIHKDKNGKPIDYVILGNNQVIAIYENEQKVKRGVGISFWEAVERMSQKLPLIEPEHEKFGKWLMNIMKTDMFLLNLPEDVDITNPKNRRLLSKHLYKVQSISVDPNGTSTAIWFFHHLETKVEKTSAVLKMKRGMQIASMDALFKMNPIKIHLNNLGKIERVML